MAIDKRENLYNLKEQAESYKKSQVFKSGYGENCG